MIDFLLYRYQGLKVGANSTMNHNYWGNLCGKPNNATTHYIEDSVSVDTSRFIVMISMFVVSSIFVVRDIFFISRVTSVSFPPATCLQDRMATWP